MKRKNKEAIKQENINDVASNVPSIVETSNKKSKNKFITKILSNKFVDKRTFANIASANKSKLWHSILQNLVLFSNRSEISCTFYFHVYILSNFSCFWQAHYSKKEGFCLLYLFSLLLWKLRNWCSHHRPNL